MRELDENQINFLIDMEKTEGWKIYISLIKEQIEMARKMATQRKILLEDERNAIWYSAEAEALERSLNVINKYK